MSVYNSFCPPKKVIRLLWISIVLICVFFWTHFLYTYTGDSKQAHFQKQLHHVFHTNSTKHHYGSSFIKDTKHQLSFTKDLGLFKIEGHDQGEIKNLLSNVSVEKVVDATAILYTSDKKSMDNIKSQLNKVLYQTIHPKKIWIMCYSCKKPKKIEEALIKMVTDYQGIELNVKQVNQLPLWEGFDETTQWIQQYDIDTEYAWVLEPGFFPNSDYLYSVYGLLQTKEYQSSLIGTEGSLLPPAATLDNIGSTITCLSKVKQSQPADMIHGSWLLHSKWINIFREHPNINRLPLSYYISHTLLYYHDISTVLLPSQTLDSEETVKDEDTAMLCRSAQSLFKFPLKESPLPTTLDYQRVSGKGPEGHIAIVIHDQGQLSAMMPLVKRFLTQQKGTLISIIIYGDISTHDLKVKLQQINFSTENVMIISISDSTKYADNVFKMTRLLEIIHPDVTLQIKEETMHYYAVVEVTNYQHITCISLLENEIKHGLWISDLPVQSLKAWNDVKIDLVAITDQRAKSLRRLLSSLNNAFYLGDKNVEVAIHMEKTSDKETQNLVQDFHWEHGEKKIRHRIRKGGLMPAIVESWYPASDDHYGVILEDDIELSPFFYIWTKYSILKYRYGYQDAIDKHKKIYGISLYSPRNLELLPAGRVPFSPEPVLEKGGYNKRTPYVTPIPCSWGAVYFPEHWREFHNYLTNRLDDNGFEKKMYNITVPKSRSERWKKSWKKYFIELVYLRGYVMVYPNFEAFESFSTNHLEYGTHVKKNKKDSRAQAKIDAFRVPLMQNDHILNQLPENRLPNLDKLPVLNLWGQLESSLETLDDIGSRWHSRVSSCERAGSDFDPSDLFCPFPEN